jgi:hypothetical protein
MRIRFVASLIALAAAARLVFLRWLHPLNWDEIEYFRATDWVRRGLVPYRDFWEHHTPLQWFVFAPLSALARGDGAGAILFMRLMQVPLWMVTFWLLWRWMRRAGVSALAAACAILLLVCSSMFMLAAVEYRIDALGCALFAAGLLLLQDVERGRAWAIAAGVAFSLAGLANIRLGPLLALTVGMAIVRNRRALWTAAGAVVVLSLAALYFALQHAASIAFRCVWTENYLGDRYSSEPMSEVLHRLAVPFGFPRNAFDPAAFDAATVLLFIAGSIGLIRAVRRRGDLFFLAVLQIGSILFIAVMKFVYHYHFLIVLLLLLPLAAAEIDRLLPHRWPVIAAALIVVSAVNLFASLFRGKEGDLAYQDFVMREVHRRTPAGGKLFDGVGWAIRRPPAYRYWFLPTLVVSLEGKVFEPYTAAQMISDPPAAIITDYRAMTWLQTHPSLAAYATRHYVPEWRNLWLPGMSARLRAGESATFVVPASGTYRVVASPALAQHPWFGRELLVGSLPLRARVDVDLTRFGPPVGIDLPPRFTLTRRQTLRVTATEEVGLFIVPAERERLFLQPPGNVTLDAAMPPVTHIPR